jgi:hypothetical protein
VSGLVQGLRERAKWCNMQPGYRQIGFEVATAADRIIELEALLGNAVGAIIDSGGYCEGPRDVADAIYRLTAERDAALGAMRGVSEAFVIADPGAAKFYLQALREGQIPPSAVGGAPGVSETHTDPKEGQQ